MTQLVSNANHRVIDIAVTPKRELLAFVDIKNYVNIRHWDDLKSIELPTPFIQMKDSQILAIDISPDGSELSLVAPILENHECVRPVWRSEVNRYSLLTGEKIQAVTLPGLLRQVRYIGSSNILFLSGRLSSAQERMGCFGFLGTDRQEVDGMYEVDGLIESVTIDPSPSGHLTICLDKGALLQWQRKDWPANWKVMPQKY